MFNTSLRQAARTCPNAAFAARNVPVPVSRSAATFATKGHQRRHSSSKPPVPPNDGSSSIPATSVKQVGAPRSTEKRSGAESRLSKRKSGKNDKTEQVKQAPEAKDNGWSTLPSVPSTQHLHPKDVFVAAFFSTHRPISISGTLPETQIEDIEKIFQARPKKTKSRNNPAEVMYTLGNVVQTLDEHIQNPQQQDPAVEQKVDLIKALTQHNNAVSQTQHLDGQPQRVGSVKVVIEEIAKRFRPFNTPPAPVPVPEIDFHSKELNVIDAEAEANETLQAQQLETEIETQQSIPAQDQFSIRSGSFFTPHQSPVAEPHTQASRGRRMKRGIYADPRRKHPILKYQLISVKRQRRLKMKKHKYKKLMRKTRNLRRRQDKL